MAVQYIGGGFLVGVPRRDMTGAEVAALPPDVRACVTRSAFYRQCSDNEVAVERADWRIEPKISRVLVACPTYRFEPESRESIFALQWGGALDWYLTRDNPYSQENQRGYFNIWHNLSKARQVCLNGNYDAMLVVESDIIAPHDTLTKLAALDCDIAGGLYVMRHGRPVPNAFVYVKGQTSAGTFYEPRDLAWGKVMRANGVCTGCTLIHRHVLERIEFRMHESAAPDWSFMEDCNTAGYVTLCDTSVVCGHVRPDGVALWPTADGWREEKRK